MLVVAIGDPERGKTYWAMGEAAQMTPALAVVADPENYPDWRQLTVDEYRDGGQWDIERAILVDRPKAIIALLKEIEEKNVRELHSLVLDEFDLFLKEDEDAMDSVARRHRHRYTLPEIGCTMIMSQSFVSLERYVSCCTYLRMHQLSGEMDIRRARFHDRPERRVTEGPGQCPQEWASMDIEAILRDPRLCHGAWVLEKKTARIFHDGCGCEGSIGTV